MEAFAILGEDALFRGTQFDGEVSGASDDDRSTTGLFADLLGGDLFEVTLWNGRLRLT
nr:hypothetical protein [Mycobacterium branderi]